MSWRVFIRSFTIHDFVTQFCDDPVFLFFSPPGTLLIPTLTLLSPHTVFSSGEVVRFSCSVLLGHHISDFHLYKHGASTPLVTQRADHTQTRVELTLSDTETFHQGSYSCRYRIKGGFPSQLLSSPPSNSINITVGETLTIVSPISTLLHQFCCVCIGFFAQLRFMGVVLISLMSFVFVSGLICNFTPFIYYYITA